MLSYGEFAFFSELKKQIFTAFIEKFRTLLLTPTKTFKFFNEGNS